MTTKLPTHPSVANFGSKIVLALWYTLCSVLGIFSAETVQTGSYTHIRFWCKCKCTEWAKKTDHFLKCITLLYNDIGRHSIYQNVQLFIGSKNDILNAAVFK